MNSDCESATSTRSEESSVVSTSSRRSRAFAAIKRSPSLLSYSRSKNSSRRDHRRSSLAQSHPDKEPKWVEAEHGLEYLHHGDSGMLRATLDGEFSLSIHILLLILLEVASANYPGGDLFFRKIHTGSSGEIINWQLKCKHDSDICLLALTI